ncbi:hypothetical protein L1887_23197 [Cichorium endivia]|nr:hypothetical protein L1887_23197 [Cichorium endivia]
MRPLPTFDIDELAPRRIWLMERPSMELNAELISGWSRDEDDVREREIEPTVKLGRMPPATALKSAVVDGFNGGDGEHDGVDSDKEDVEDAGGEDEDAEDVLLSREDVPRPPFKSSSGIVG